MKFIFLLLAVLVGKVNTFGQCDTIIIGKWKIVSVFNGEIYINSFPAESPPTIDNLPSRCLTDSLCAVACGLGVSVATNVDEALQMVINNSTETTAHSFLTLTQTQRNVHCQSAFRSFFVFAVHIQRSLPHSFHNGI